MQQRTHIVSAIMDHPSYKSETAEEWMNRNGWSLDTILKSEASKLLKKLTAP